MSHLQKLFLYHLMEIFQSTVEGPFCGSTGPIHWACGGYQAGGSCFRLNSTSNTWIRESNLTSDRYYAKTVELSDTELLIAGGTGPDNSPLRSTEILSIGSDGSVSTHPGPDLPEHVTLHCVAKLNSSFVVLAGGLSGESGISRHAYLLNVLTNRWIRLPDMSHER